MLNTFNKMKCKVENMSRELETIIKNQREIFLTEK